MNRRFAEKEAGFTIVEVLIAALILVLGAIATFGILSSATRSAQRAKGSQVALDKAQQEMEYLRSLTDEELAMTSTPPHEGDENNPNFRVSNGKFALQRTPVGEYKLMVANGGKGYSDEELTKGVVSSGPTSFSSGDVSGEVYRYVVWRNDPNCAAETCPGEKDYKQIIVAVKLDAKGNQGNPGGYVEVQSNFVDPERSAADNPIPGAEGVVTAQQFFLSDTPCEVSGEPARQEVTADNALHNTMGTCFNGLQTGTTNGAPDALLTGAPPDPTPEDESTPLTYDYSNDYPGSPSPETAKGIQLRRDDTTGCHYKPENKTAPQWRVHRWLTAPMPKEFVMTSGESLSSVTIDFFTRSLSDSQYAGKLCMYLFKREAETESTYTDTMITNREGGAAYWTYSGSYLGTKYWPYGQWVEVILTLNFNGPVKVPKEARLGVALSLDASTQGDAVSILYDHPRYRSRIEVDTTTPLEGG
jgi:type II secretory pathway pseudopilin PulG